MNIVRNCIPIRNCMPRERLRSESHFRLVFSSSDDESDWKLKNKMSNLANKIKSLKKKNNSEQDDPDSVEMKTNIAENQNQNDLESGLGKY